MAAMGAEYARYRVTFSVRGQIRQSTRTVSLMENYTTWADIPKILSISMGVDADRIVITELSTLPIATTDMEAAYQGPSALLAELSD